MFQAYLVPIMTDVPFIIGPPLYTLWHRVQGSRRDETTIIMEVLWKLDIIEKS